MKKMVTDASLLNNQHYNVQIKSKCSNPSKGVAPIGVVVTEKEAPGSPNFLFISNYHHCYALMNIIELITI